MRGLIIIALLIAGNIFAKVDSIGPETFVIEYNGSIYKTPYHSNADIDSTNDVVEHAIFVMHGSDRNLK